MEGCALATDPKNKPDKKRGGSDNRDINNNTMSQKAITEALQKAVNIDIIYPVGVVIWFAQNKNPNSLFPGTTGNTGSDSSVLVVNAYIMLMEWYRTV